jgi:hypothetical protein
MSEVLRLLGVCNYGWNQLAQDVVHWRTDSCEQGNEPSVFSIARECIINSPVEIHRVS